MTFPRFLLVVLPHRRALPPVGSVFWLVCCIWVDDISYVIGSSPNQAIGLNLVNGGYAVIKDRNIQCDMSGLFVFKNNISYSQFEIYGSPM